jgi:hypothetical protein
MTNLHLHKNWFLRTAQQQFWRRSKLWLWRIILYEDAEKFISSTSTRSSVIHACKK